MSNARPKELTDPACRNAKSKATPWKLHDVRGLFLLVNPGGTKWWRLRYRLNGKDGLLSLREETQRLESLYQQKLRALIDLKKSLLHQAFSGQL